MNLFPFILGVTVFIAGVILFTRWSQRAELIRMTGELERAFGQESYDRTVEEDNFVVAYRKHVREFPEDLRSKKFGPVRAMFAKLADSHRRSYLD